MKQPHVLIVGAGIIGASIAWHLARAGAAVTVVDAHEPGGIATRNSWAWINASWGNPEPYFRLRVRAIHEWHRLEREVPDLDVAWVGSLLWELPPDDLKTFQAQHSAWGYEVRLVDRAEICRIEPHLIDPPEFAAHSPAEGAVEPLSATQALLSAAEALAAKVIANNPVSSLKMRGGRVIGAETSIGLVEADEVVVAAGVGAPALLSTIGLRLPIRAAPALLVRTRPHDKRLNGLVMTPEMQLRQTPSGQFVAALEFKARESDAEEMRAAAALDLIKGTIASISALTIESHMVGIRPIPEDRFPVVGRAPGIAGLYVAVTHSGIIIVGLRGSSWSFSRGIGDALFPFASFLTACYTVILRQAKLDPIHAAALVSTGSMVVYVPTYIALHGLHFAGVSSTALITQVVFQGIVVTIISLALYARAVAILGASGGSAFGALVPALSALLALPLLDEWPTNSGWIAIALVSGGVYLASRGPPERTVPN